MGEISAKPIQTILRTAVTRFGIDVPPLLDSVAPGTSRRVRTDARLPWDLCCKVLERLEGAIGGREATKKFFEGHFDGPERKRLLGGFASLFADSRQLYRYASNVYAPGHLPLFETTLDIQPDGTLVLDVRLPIEARDCPPFWWGLGSFLRRIPSLLGQSEALVDVQVGDRLAVYRITPPPPLTIATRLRSSVRGFFGHHSAAELAREQALEIERLHTALIETRERLEREIVKASHRERQRVAHDLHDGLGQQLTAVSLHAKLLEGTLRDCAPEYAAEAAQFVDDVKEATKLARNLAHGLDRIGRRNATSDAPTSPD